MRCRYAESGLYISANKRLSPCCAIFSHEDTIEFSNIKQEAEEYIQNFRKLSYKNSIENHPLCKKCIDVESQGFTSQRLRGQRVISPNRKYQYQKIIKRLDISFSNTCNLDCVMCRPIYSSKWNNIAEKMPHSLQSGTGITSIKNKFMDYDTIDDIITKHGKTLESVAIKGGEVFYDKRAKYFLEKLADVNPDIKIDITTNATVLDFDLIKKFKKISLTCSVDGIHEIYEYIRGYDFKIIDDNLERLKKMENVSLWIAITVSYFNFHILPQTIKYFYQKDIKNVQVDSVREPWISPSLYSKKQFKRICKESPIMLKWKRQELPNNTYEVHEDYKKFWNEHRNMDWDTIDVSKY